MKIIESIQYAPADQIVSWFENKRFVQVQTYGGWTYLPMHVASGEMSHTTKPDKSGTQHTVQIAARLIVATTLPDLVVLAVKLCDGTTLIVGTPDIPVQSNESNTLYLHSLAINYTGINPPLISQEV